MDKNSDSSINGAEKDKQSPPGSDKSNIQETQKSNNRQNYSLQKTANIILALTLATTICAGFIAYYTYQFYERSFRISSKPRVILLEKKIDSKKYEISIWNVGPGIAYDVEYNVHFSGSYIRGLTGSPYMMRVIKNALYFKTKSKRELTYNQTFAAPLSAARPPTVLPPNMNIGYAMSNEYAILEGLYIYLKYKDNQKNHFYSLWDGYKWTFGEENHEISPGKETKDDVVLFLDDLIRLYERNKSYAQRDEDGFNFYDAVNWLLKEAKYLELKGDKDIRKEIKKMKEKYPNNVIFKWDLDGIFNEQEIVQ